MSKPNKDGRGEHMRKLWRDPEFRERHATALRASMTPERNAKIAARTKASWRDPEVRARRGASISAAAAKRVARQRKVIARASAGDGRSSAENKRAKAIEQKQRWENPEFREKVAAKQKRFAVTLSGGEPVTHVVRFLNGGDVNGDIIAPPPQTLIDKFLRRPVPEIG